MGDFKRIFWYSEIRSENFSTGLVLKKCFKRFLNFLTRVFFDLAGFKTFSSRSCFDQTFFWICSSRSCFDHKFLLNLFLSIILWTFFTQKCRFYLFYFFCFWSFLLYRTKLFVFHFVSKLNLFSSTTPKSFVAQMSFAKRQVKLVNRTKLGFVVKFVVVASFSPKLKKKTATKKLLLLL